MFPSSGYFRGLDCPFYASGLCERPYCHYRHAKQSSEKDHSWIGKSTTINQKINNQVGDTLLDTDRGVLIENAGPPKEVDKTFTKPTYSSCTLNTDLTKLYTYKPQSALSGGTYDKTNDAGSDSSKYKTYTKYNCDGVSNYQPSCDNQIKKGRYEEYSVSKKKEKKVSEYNCDIALNSVPEYNPTPISELKRMHKYSTQSTTHSDLEYDPVSNFDAGFSKKSFFNLLDNSYPSNQSVEKLTSGHSVYKPTRIPSDDEECELVIDAKFSDESDDEINSRLSEPGSDSETKDSTISRVQFSSLSKTNAEDSNYSTLGSNPPSYSVSYKGTGDDDKNVSAISNKHVKIDPKSSSIEKSNNSSKSTNNVKQHSSSETESSKLKIVLNDKNKLEKNAKSSPDKKKKISETDKLSLEKKSSSDKKTLTSEKKPLGEKKSSSSSHNKISSSEKKVSSSSSEKRSSGCASSSSLSSSSSSRDQNSVKKDKKEPCSKEKLAAEKVKKIKENKSIQNEKINGSRDKDRCMNERERRKSESDRNRAPAKERVVKSENKKIEISSSLLKRSNGEHSKNKIDLQTKSEPNRIKLDPEHKKEIERRKSEGERKTESNSKKSEVVCRKSESDIKKHQLEKKSASMSCKNSLYLKRKESEKKSSKDSSLIERVRQETLLTKTEKLQRAKDLNERVEVWKANKAEQKTNPERDKIPEKARKTESNRASDSTKKLTYSSSDNKKSTTTSNNLHEKSKKREFPSGENSHEHSSKISKRNNSERQRCSLSDENLSSKKHTSSDLSKSSKHQISNHSTSKQRPSSVIKDKKNRSISIDDLFGEESSEDEGEESSGAFGHSGGDESTGLSDDEINVIFGDTDLSETDPYEECLKIFNETNLQIQQQKKQQQQQQQQQQQVMAKDIPKKEEIVDIPTLEEGKKRVAHPGAVSRATSERLKTFVRPALARPSPAQVMQNRFLEKQKRLAAESMLQKKKPLTNLIPSQSKIDLLKQKMSLSTIGNPKSCNVYERTIAGTAAKNEKRMAHMPKKDTMEIPTVISDISSKITTVVRQRYLNLIIEECKKIASSRNEAITMGMKEEKEVFENCGSKIVYLNKAIHLIKRLRKNNMFRISNSDNQQITTMIPAPSVQGTRKQEPLLTGRALYDMLKCYILSEEDLRENHFPRPDTPGKATFYLDDIRKDPYLLRDERFCVRCAKSYRVDSSGKSVVEEECMYHWAKPVAKKCGNSYERRYRCCQADTGSTTGCEVALAHVHHKNKFDGSSGYMTTTHRSMASESPGVFAMDCEMVYTTAGMEVARVTVVNYECNVVYESFVKPANEILDYNTRFSGIQEEDLKDVQTTLIHVQAILLHYFSAETILVGHSLESDLMSVKLIHSTVIDTSVLFPHRVGKPYKRALKNLTQDYLNTTIQDGVNGHDSKEDAIAAMKLVHYRLRQDSKTKQ